ncbi:MAG: molybdate ABC transporter substrate-binding protein [Alphaproteobacteria bacterium]|nr:molybdate ABC transporter substrate-binding protein [Alphaproteobacteria bacterium]
MKPRKLARLMAAVMAVLGFSAGCVVFAKAADSEGNAPEIKVFAALSTTEAVSEIASLFTSSGKGKVTTSFAATPALVWQIEHGAPANIFISADEASMDALEQHKRINPATRVDLLGNHLVLIAPAAAAVSPITIGPGFPLAALLGDKRLAVANPDRVPAGIYAKESLEKLGVWSAVESRLARADSVRTALAFVEQDVTPLGIVYSTDAAHSPKVKVVATFPEESHGPILYPAALVAANQTPGAASFLAFLNKPEARNIFTRHGFIVK